MSDGLIERLEKAKSDLAPYDRESVAKSIHLNTISIDAILSALKTVRGIEGDERKGILVWCDIIEDLECFSGYQWQRQVERGTYSITLYETIRDLMLAGF